MEIKAFFPHAVSDGGPGSLPKSLLPAVSITEGKLMKYPSPVGSGDIPFSAFLEVNEAVPDMYINMRFVKNIATIRTGSFLFFTISFGKRRFPHRVAISSLHIVTTKEKFLKTFELESSDTDYAIPLSYVPIALEVDSPIVSRVVSKILPRTFLVQC